MGAGVRRGFIFGGCALLAVLAFQNCSDFALQDELIYEQSLLESREALDAATLPLLLESASLKKWFKRSSPTFVDEPTLIGDQWSMVIAVDKTATGKIMTLHSGAGIEEGFVSITGGKVRATRTQAAPAYTVYKEADLPTAGDKVLIGVSFGAAKTDISIMLNGIVQTNPTSGSSGTPSDFSYIAKQVVITDPGSKIDEYVVYVGDSRDEEGNLSFPELNVMSRYIANNNTIPNVIYDPALIDIDTGPGGVEVNPKFILAKAVFDGKCIVCHKSGGDYPNLVNLTESKAVSNGWVIAKNKMASSLYNRLQGSGGANPNMPKTGSINAAEVQIVADWIDSIQ